MTMEGKIKMTILNSFKKLKNKQTTSFLAILLFILFLLLTFKFNNYNLNTKFFI